MSEAGSGAMAVAASASSALGTDVTHAFWEVLSYSKLLEDGGIKEAFLASLAKVDGWMLRSCNTSSRFTTTLLLLAIASRWRVVD